MLAGTTNQSDCGRESGRGSCSYAASGSGKVEIKGGVLGV